MSDFIKHSWYVAAWTTDLLDGAILGREVAGESVAIYRRSDRKLVALENRCPHRQAPLSAGQLEGDELPCMYHGIKYNSDGHCVSVGDGSDSAPTQGQDVPVLEKSS